MSIGRKVISEMNCWAEENQMIPAQESPFCLYVLTF